LIVGAGGKALTDDAYGCHGNDRRHHAGEIGMQGATGVGEVAVITMPIVATMMGSIGATMMVFVILVVSVILVDLHNVGVCGWRRVGARRRHHAR
jgi:hypothetical protein